MSRNAHPKCGEVPRAQKSTLGARKGFYLMCQLQHTAAQGWICPSHHGAGSESPNPPPAGENTPSSSKGLMSIILHGPIHQVVPGVLQAPLVPIKGVSSELKIN